MKKILSSLLTLALTMVLIFKNTISVLADTPTTSTEDIDIPVIESISLSKTSGETPAQIEIISRISDLSGVASAFIEFEETNSNAAIYTSLEHFSKG